MGRKKETNTTAENNLSLYTNIYEFGRNNTRDGGITINTAEEKTK